MFIQQNKFRSYAHFQPFCRGLDVSDKKNISTKSGTCMYRNFWQKVSENAVCKISAILFRPQYVKQIKVNRCRRLEPCVLVSGRFATNSRYIVFIPLQVKLLYCVNTHICDAWPRRVNISCGRCGCTANSRYCVPLMDMIPYIWG